MIFTSQQYIEAPAIKLPYQSPAGISVLELGAQCKNCNKKTNGLRGFIQEHENCMEIRFAGVCHPCKLITSCQMRYYKDGRIMSYKDNGWCEIDTQANWFSSLLKKIKKLLSFNWFVV